MQVDPPWNVPQSDWAGDLAGQTIPGGDPANPLVARWIGFNGSVGFHGTASIGSIGVGRLARLRADAPRRRDRPVRPRRRRDAGPRRLSRAGHGVAVTPVFPGYPSSLDAADGAGYDRPVRAIDVPGGGTVLLVCGAVVRAWSARC